MNLTHRIQQTIQKRDIFQQDDLILVALSGGADSVALLLILEDLGYKLQALHCNFHLRGEESDRDERFARKLCEQHHIPLHVKHFDTKSYAQEHKQSLEMAARELRYAWFEEKRKELGAQAIAVAHHRDDQAETLLLNIVRGTGMRGLAGMRFCNGSVRRPLLEASREDILNYLSLKGQDYVTDSTNLEREALRNRIRLDILPALAKLNPNISETLSTLASNIQDALPIYEQGLANIKNNTAENNSSSATDSKIPIDSATLTVLHEWLSPYGFNRTQLENILESETGKMIESATHRLLRDRHDYILQDKSKKSKQAELSFETIAANELGTMVRGNAYLDKAKVKMPIQRRRVQAADRFTPLGMKGSKLVSDYLTDLKLNRFEKEQQEVLTDADGQILWIVGHATSHPFRITPSTKEVLIIRSLTK